MSNQLRIPASIPPEKLDAFDSYEDFIEVAASLVDLDPEEFPALFKVLVKLQSVGEDPLQTLQDCRFKMNPRDCLQMLRFMIKIDEMDLAEMNASA